MRRGALIYRSHRQLALARSVLGRQQLVTRLTRYQQLPQALGLPDLFDLPVSQALPVSLALAGTIPALPTVDWNGRAAFVIQPEDAGDGDMHIVTPSTMGQGHGESIRVQPSTELAMQQETTVQQEQPPAIGPGQQAMQVETPLQAATQEIEQRADTPQGAPGEAVTMGVTQTHQSREKSIANQSSTPARHQDNVPPHVEADVRSILPVTAKVKRVDQLLSPKQSERQIADQLPSSAQQAAASAGVTVPATEPIKVILEGEVASEDISEAEGVVPDSVPETEIVAEHEDVPEISISDVPAAQVGRQGEPKSFTGQQEDVQSPLGLIAPASGIVQPLAEDVGGSVDEAVQPWQDDDAGRQVERGIANETIVPVSGKGAKTPIETVRPRRPRKSIVELSAQAGHRSPPSIPVTQKETQGPQPNAQAPKAGQRPEPETTGEDGIHADELFAPTHTDRSPQAWLARLTGKSVPAQEEVAPDTGMWEGLPVANGGSEAPADEGSSLPLPQQRREQPQEVKESLVHPAQSGYRATPQQSGEQGPVMKGQSREQGEDQTQAQTVSVTRFDRAESIAPVRKARVQSHPQAEARQLRGQGQKQVEKANALRAVPGEPGKPGMVEAATTQARQPEQLSSRTRRFLRPLLGIDPASVQVYRDAQATRLADAYHADALTVGDAVELPASNASETPEALGLLAHELTHVARQRGQGFVPPILQAQQDVEDGSGAYRVGPPARRGGLGATMDEEALALQVERQVRQGAREQVRKLGTIIPPAQDTVSLSPARPLVPNEPVETRRAAHDPWGGLPAPWEPLPGWLTTPVHPTPMEQSVASFPASVPALTASLAQPMASHGSHHQANGSTEARAQRAEIGRSIGKDAISPASSVREVRAPEPDLDELARQVYSIVRNRLEVERRRHR